jgi:hypothetical protein
MSKLGSFGTMGAKKSENAVAAVDTKTEDVRELKPIEK